MATDEKVSPRLVTESVSSCDQVAAGAQLMTDPEVTGNRYIINHEDLDPNELDELELFPGGLELPPMRSPRGSLHSIYGGGGGSPSRSVTILILISLILDNVRYVVVHSYFMVCKQAASLTLK